MSPGSSPSSTPTSARSSTRSRAASSTTARPITPRASARTSSRSATASTSRSSGSGPAPACACSYLNTSRPLFRNNPKLRQAVNFAVDRKALARERGLSPADATDQYLSPVTPALQGRAHLPAQGPDLKKARALAKGHTRSGKAVLYTGDEARRRRPGADPPAEPQGDRARARDQARFPATLFGKLATPRRAVRPRPRLLRPLARPLGLHFFDGRTIGEPGIGNWSYFNSPKYNRLLDEASRLTGGERYRAYGELDVQLSRDAAPAIPIASVNAIDVRLRPRRLRRHEPVPRPDGGLPQVTRALAATLFAALVLIPAAGTHGIKEGGTFRIAIGASSPIDPHSPGPHSRRRTCGALMTYPDEPLPEGLHCARARAADPSCPKDGKTYTFTIRRTRASRRHAV